MKFDSRKNEVKLLNNIVIKKFTDYSRLVNEKDALVNLDGVFSPKLLDENKDLLFIEYIDGTLLLDEYMSADIDKAQFLAAQLAKTIKYIYNKIGKITFDENFRNYICNKNKIYRIDFEEITDGNLTQWCSKILAFAFLYEVPTDIKYFFSTCLVQSLGVSKSNLVLPLKQELSFLSKRWKTSFPIDFYNRFELFLND